MTNLSNNSNINKNNKSLKTIISNISNLFFQKYYINEFEYGRKVINDIIFNEPSHIVALFKDFLIIDDYSEFLKRFYKKYESLDRLPQFCLYYETYSRIYPNYTPLKESIYIYKNIHKKQKMIDLQIQLDYKIQKQNLKKKLNNFINNSLDESNKKKLDNQVFSTDIYNSIVNNSDNKEELYYLFGIDKFNNNNSNSIEEIKKIIKNIRKNDLNDCLKDCSKSIISDSSLLIINQNKNNNIDHRNNRREDNNNNNKNNNKNYQKSNKIFSDLTKQLFSIKCEKFSQTTNLSKNNSQIKISTNQSLINNSINNLNNNKIFKKNKIFNNVDLKLINKVKNKHNKEKTDYKYNKKNNNSIINQFGKHHNSISSNKKKILYIKNQMYEPSLKNLFIKKIYPYTQRNENRINNNSNIKKTNKSNSNKKSKEKKKIRNKTNSPIKISPFSNKNNYNNCNNLKCERIKKY